jgi:hypothetical protein
VNKLGILQAHPTRKEKGAYIIHALYGGVDVTLLFLEKGNTLMIFPKEGSSTFSHSTTTELPAPVASFSFPKTHPLTHCPVYGGFKNTNCHTTPDSSIPVDTDYSNRFELRVEGYTLPTSPVSAISPS